MSILGALDSATFIQHYWQRKPLLVRNALDPVPDLVDGDTLAGLACEPQVDARLVNVDPTGTDWSCEHGPFDESRFAHLPAGGWTLLVQAVDQWIPEVAALLAHFDFLPRWRMDDVMVSYATDGGGVGPHFDQYDVFLLQAQGTRNWQVGQQCNVQTPLRDHPDLALMESFDARSDWVLEAGDMLYLPPRVAHWGTAVGDDCITCSIGFRAPSQAEVIQGVVDLELSRMDEHRRFLDVPASVDTDPYYINEAAVESARALWPGEALPGSTETLATAFGRLVTEPRSPALIEPDAGVDAGALRELLAGESAVAFVHNPCSRLAYRLAGDAAELFVDGESHAVSQAVARGICQGRLDACDRTDGATRELLVRLFLSGSLLAPRVAAG